MANKAGNRLTPGSKTPTLDFVNDVSELAARKVRRGASAVWRNATFRQDSATGQWGASGLERAARLWGGDADVRRQIQAERQNLPGQPGDVIPAKGRGFFNRNQTADGSMRDRSGTRPDLSNSGLKRG